MNAKQVTFNEATGLFVVPAGDGYTCLGLEVCRRRVEALGAELNELHGRHVPSMTPMELYAFYLRLVEMARQRNTATGWRSSSELTPELCGLEGRRVEVVHTWESSGRREVSRFQVGRSTGFIPCHLALANRRSSGGSAVCLGKIESVRIVR